METPDSPAIHIWDNYTRSLLALLQKERDPRHSSFARQMVDKAYERLEGAAFIGLTEHWKASICLFHKQFGGTESPSETRRLVDALSLKLWHRIASRMTSREGDDVKLSSGGDAYRAFSSLANSPSAEQSGASSGGDSAAAVNSTAQGLMIKAAQRELVRELQGFGFRDWMDELVYKRAQSIFFRRAVQHGCLGAIPESPPPSPPPPPPPPPPKRRTRRHRHSQKRESQMSKPPGSSDGGGADSNRGSRGQVCTQGVRSLGGHGSVCCARGCGACDGMGCSSRPGGPQVIPSCGTELSCVALPCIPSHTQCLPPCLPDHRLAA